MRLLFGIIAICGSGVFTGAMLTIGLTLGGFWKSLPPAEFLDWFSTNESLIVQSIAVAAVPTMVGVLGSLWFGPNSARLWWGVAVVALLALGAITAIFHLPINAVFAAKSIPLDQVAATVDRWLLVHNARIALGLLATVAGMVAITR
jgi:hypothetical protein